MFFIKRDTPLTRVTLSPLLNPHSLLTFLDYSTGFGELFVPLISAAAPRGALSSDKRALGCSALLNLQDSRFKNNKKKFLSWTSTPVRMQGRRRKQHNPLQALLGWSEGTEKLRNRILDGIVELEMGTALGFTAPHILTLIPSGSESSSSFSWESPKR